MPVLVFDQELDRELFSNRNLKDQGFVDKLESISRDAIVLFDGPNEASRRRLEVALRARLETIRFCWILAARIQYLAPRGALVQQIALHFFVSQKKEAAEETAQTGRGLDKTVSLLPSNDQ